MLDFVDEELVEALQYHLRGLGVVLRLGEEVAGVERRPDGDVLTVLASGKRIPSDAVLYAAGRQGATDGLELAAAGPRGRRARPHRGRRRATAPRSRTSSRPATSSASRASPRPRWSRDGSRRWRPSASPRARCPTLLPYGIYTVPGGVVRRPQRGRADRGGRALRPRARAATAS